MPLLYALGGLILRGVSLGSRVLTFGPIRTILGLFGITAVTIYSIPALITNMLNDKQFRLVFAITGILIVVVTLLLRRN